MNGCIFLPAYELVRIIEPPPAPTTWRAAAPILDRAPGLLEVLGGGLVVGDAHPVVAAVLNAGGLWLLYAPDLFAEMHSAPALHVVVRVLNLLAGLASTVAAIGLDPSLRRASLRTRATVLMLFFRARSVPGKWLYAHPPAGVDPAGARVCAELMYYGGDIVDLAILVLLFAGWYPGSRFRSRLLPGNPGVGRLHPGIDATRDPLESGHRIDERGPAWRRRSASAN